MRKADSQQANPRDQRPPLPGGSERTPIAIGREREMSALAEALAGHPVVAVCGPLGIGKTTLVLATLALEHAAGRIPVPVRVSTTGITEGRELLASTVRVLRGAHWPRFPARVVATLRRLLDENPVSLVWDDIEPLPSPTVAVAELLALTTSAWRLVLVSRSRLDRPGIPLIELRPLSIESCRDLVAVLEQDQGLTISEAIARQSGGNPLLVKNAVNKLYPSAASAPQEELPDMLAAAAEGPARWALHLLAAAEVPLGERELAQAAPAAASQIERLQSLGLAERGPQGDVTLRTGLASLARQRLGPPPESVWNALEMLLEQKRGQADSLMLACRVKLALHGAQAALEHVTRETALSQVASLEELSDALAMITAVAPELEFAGGLLLAKEQLRHGAVDDSLYTLNEIAPHAPEHQQHDLELLRARALARTGTLRDARSTLTSARMHAMDDEVRLSIEVAHAALSVLRVEPRQARALLRSLGPQTRRYRLLEQQRRLAIGLSYFLEERFHRSLAWVRRARRGGPRTGVGASLEGALEVLSLLGLDEIDRAEALIEQRPVQGLDTAEESLGVDLPSLFLAAVYGRRGDMEQCLATSEPALRAFSESADQVPRAFLLRYLGRAALALGRLPDAERLLRSAAGLALQSGLVSLAPLCDRDLALLFLARGQYAEARIQLRESAQACPRSPLIAIEFWASGASPPPSLSGAPASVRAYADLHLAERALASEALDDAEGAAMRAAEHYRRAGADYEHSRALLVVAETSVHRGTFATSSALDECGTIARRRGYVPILVGLDLIRAALADRAGQLETCACALARARVRGASGPRFISALNRIGLATISIGGSTAVDARIGRLQLTRPCDRALATDEGVFLLGEEEEVIARAFDLLLDLDVRQVSSGANGAQLTNQQVRLLDLLIQSGARGAGLEDVFLYALGGREYHVLRHRSSAYVAMTRLRTALEPLIGKQAILEGTDGRYRLRPGLRSATLTSASGARPDAALPQESSLPAADLVRVASRLERSLLSVRWAIAIDAAERSQRA